jgi:hypothetical protein
MAKNVKALVIEGKMYPVKGEKVPIIAHGTSDTIFTLPPNEFHVWGEVSTLVITLGEQDSGHLSEYMFEFISGATPTVLTLPTSVKFPEDYEIEANKKYQVSIVDNIGLIVGVDYE